MADAATKLTVVRNPAEEGFLKAYAGAAGALPGTDKIAQARRDAMAKFEELGLPHRRVEEWKYTDLRARIKDAYPVASGGSFDRAAVDAALGTLADLDTTTMVLVDGVFDATLSTIDADGLTVKPLAEALADDCFAGMHATLPGVLEHDTTVALNTGLMTDGAAVHVASTQLKPLHIVHVATASTESAVTTRNIVYVGGSVDVTVIETFVTLGEAGVQVNALTHLGADPKSNVLHVQVKTENTDSIHLGTWVIDVAEESTYRSLQVTTGAALTRNQIYLNFQGPDASAHMNAAYLQRGTQHCDSTLYVDHVPTGCESRELYKGVLDDEARGVFQGKIMVKAEAQKTDGKQMAQALLLSDEAEFDSKPELEIFADDVVCGHGSTSGAIDEDLLFYLRSRGIPEKKARALLVQAFVGEAIVIVEEQEELYNALMGIAEEWLSETV